MPPVPDETAHIWRWFGELSRARSAGWSVEALSWSDINSFFASMRITPQRWELRTLTDLDDAFLSSRLDKKVATAKSAKALKGRLTGEQK